MTVGADDVRRRLAAGEAEAARVAIESRVEVATPAALDSPKCRETRQIATHRKIMQHADGEQLSERELADQTAGLDTAVRNLGGWPHGRMPRHTVSVPTLDAGSPQGKVDAPRSAPEPGRLRRVSLAGCADRRRVRKYDQRVGKVICLRRVRLGSIAA